MELVQLEKEKARLEKIDEKQVLLLHTIGGCVEEYTMYSLQCTLSATRQGKYSLVAVLYIVHRSMPFGCDSQRNW